MTRKQKRQAAEVAAAMLLLSRRTALALAASAEAIAQSSPDAMMTASGIALSGAEIIRRAKQRARSISRKTFDPRIKLDEPAEDARLARIAAASIGARFLELREASTVEKAVEDLAGRINTVASTESWRAMNAETIRIGRQDEGRFLVWSAYADACDECWDLDGNRVPAEDGFLHDPPLHPHCLPGDSLVTPGGRIAAVSDRWYEGDLVVLRTAGGNRLACTPNHPVLTLGGWVAASALDVGSYVLSQLWRDGRGRADLHHQDVPTSIQHVADSFHCADGVSASAVPLSSEDFHGDGGGSQVAVVRADRLLRNNLDTEARKHSPQLDLASARHQSALLAALRTADKGLDRVGGATASVVRALNLQGPPLLRHRRPLEEFGGGLSANLDTGFEQDSTHWSTRDAQALRDGEFRRTIEVAPDKVVGIDVESFAGHVYNLQTAQGFYLANGIVTHNCRCVIVLE